MVRLSAPLREEDLLRDPQKTAEEDLALHVLPDISLYTHLLSLCRFPLCCHRFHMDTYRLRVDALDTRGDSDTLLMRDGNVRRFHLYFPDARTP